MNLVLIGYRGTGKSAVGKLLAVRLGMRCVELDAQIVQRAGRTIPEIVRQEGWGAFRDMEARLVEESAELDGVVIDTGGGVIERSENVENLRRNGFVVWLRAEVHDIVQRISGNLQRPSLTGTSSFTDEVEQVLRARTPRYEAAADAVVDTSALSVDQAVETVARLFRERVP